MYVCLLVRWFVHSFIRLSHFARMAPFIITFLFSLSRSILVVIVVFITTDVVIDVAMTHPKTL